MKSNFLVIIFSGISISVLGLAVLMLPELVRAFFERNIECFLTIPPISVASYILVFKYHEKFENSPPLTALLNKIFQGGIAAFFCFIFLSLISSLLLRLYFTFKN